MTKAPITLLLLLFAVPASAAGVPSAGGYCIELVGSVSSNSYSSGPFGSASANDVATLSFCVLTPGQDVVPNQLTNYAIDLGTFNLDINGPTGVALGGSVDLQIQNDFPMADGFRVNGTQLASGEFFAAGFGAVGTFFPSTDITQLAGIYDVASNLTSFNYVIQGMGGMMEIFPETLTISVQLQGTNYCSAANNSTGSPAVMGASGSASVSGNDFTLEASGLPVSQFGIFLTSTSPDFVPGGSFNSNGNLCLGGVIGRFTAPSQIVGSGVVGEFSLLLDLAQFPQGTGTVAVMPGQTWYFQAWHRDSVGLGSNLTDGLEVTFF